MMFICELDSKVQNLIMTVAEMKLLYDGIEGDTLEETLENVKCERVENVIDDLIYFINEDVGNWIEETINWR